MYKHLLIATDGSDLAQKAIGHGLALAKALNAKVTAVTVTEPWTAVAYGEMAVAFPVEEYEKNMAARAGRILSEVEKAAAEVGVSCATLHIKNQLPSDGILAAAKERDCDLIVMSSHGRRGMTRLLLGSQASNVVTYSAVPVLICR